MAKKAKSETAKSETEEIKEVSVNEEVKPEEVEPKVEPKVAMSPEAIESRYQAHLEKIKAGGK